MPDYGRPAEDLERHLERSLEVYPPLDYGSALLAGRGFASGAQAPSGGRKLNGGIMMRSGYRGPTVNIRPPKWADTTFWLRAENYPDAQYIADAVYYLTGREPFHFCDAKFRYPPLRLSATRQLLTREACSAYVESIAKGAALQKQREDYRERVKELVMKAVKSPEAVLFLSSLRPVARPVPNIEAAEEIDIVDDGSEGARIEEESRSAVEAAGNFGDEFGSTDQGSPMEVDEMSVQAVQSLVPPPCETVEPASGPAFIPTFGFDWFDSESLLRSDWQSLDAGWSHLRKKAEEHMVSGSLKDFLSALDGEEEELWRLTESSVRMAWRPVSNTHSHHTLRYTRRVLPLPYPDCEAL